LTNQKFDDYKKKTGALIKLVKDQGYTTMFTHFYEPDPMGDGNGKVLVGTTCIILNASFFPMSRGNSAVSWQDRPSKAVGRYLSLKRAIDAIYSSSDYSKLKAVDQTEMSVFIGDEKNNYQVYKAIGFGDPNLFLTEIELGRIKRKKDRKALVLVEQPVVPVKKWYSKLMFWR